MYRKTNAQQMSFEKFYLPFGGKLRSQNRWMILSKQIPREEIEAKTIMERREFPLRIALGSLIIKERLGLSDRETLE